jgi:hypothetical protein
LYTILFVNTWEGTCLIWGPGAAAPLAPPSRTGPDLRHTEDQEKHGLGRRQLSAGSLTQQQTLQHANEAQHQYFYAQRHTHTGRRSGPGLALRSHCMDLRDGRRSKLHTARLILCFKSTIASLVAPAISIVSSYHQQRARFKLKTTSSII